MATDLAERVTARSTPAELAGAASGDKAFAFADGSVLRLGDQVATDGSVSWAPVLPGHVQAINCYLVREGEHAYLIDTGVSAHRARVLSQLDAVLPATTELTVAFTRAELDCSGNFGAIHGHRRVAEVVAGAIRNPFDSYDEISAMSQTEIRRQALPLSGTTTMPVAQSERLILVPPHIRMLTTYWIYDRQTRTMFTSDMFGHTTASSAEAPAVITEASNDPTTAESVASHLLEKFFWMAIADTSYMVGWLKDVFEAYPVDNIAPTHGSVLVGRGVVERHLGLVVEAMERVGIQSRASA